MTEHHWTAALLMGITDGEAKTLAKRDLAVVDEDRRVEVAEVFCRRCRQRWGQAPNSCIPFDALNDYAIKTARRMEQIREYHRMKAEQRKEAAGVAR